MGYRTIDIPPKPEDMLRRFDVRNGAIMRAAFACFYYTPKPGHDPHYHDYINWPAPNYHGDACQMLSPRDLDPHMPRPVMRTDDDMTPIRLSQEGYTEAAVTFEESDITQHLDAKTWIDPQDDWIVRLSVKADCPTFSDKPQDVRFTVFVKRPDTEHEQIDAVCHGILTVLPGSPYPTE